MRKKRIQLSTKWLKIFPNLTRNQIILCIYASGEYESKDKLIKICYPKRKQRMIEDVKILNDIIIKNDIQVFTYENVKTLSTIEPYFQIKIETFEQFLNKSKLPTKQELLVLCWLLNLYVIKQQREYEFKISEVLNDIFGKYTNQRKFKNTFIEALEMYKSFEYKNVKDCLIKDYEVNGNVLRIQLDEKLHKRTKFYYKNEK